MILNEISSKHSKDKHFLIFFGDFNAKTASGHGRFHDDICKFVKEHLNGELLPEKMMPKKRI